MALTVKNEIHPYLGKEFWYPWGSQYPASLSLMPTSPLLSPSPCLNTTTNLPLLEWGFGPQQALNLFLPSTQWLFDTKSIDHLSCVSLHDLSATYDLVDLSKLSLPWFPASFLSLILSPQPNLWMLFPSLLLDSSSLPQPFNSKQGSVGYIPVSLLSLPCHLPRFSCTYMPRIPTFIPASQILLLKGTPIMCLSTELGTKKHRQKMWSETWVDP